jgi:hypothetical protein
MKLSLVRSVIVASVAWVAVTVLASVSFFAGSATVGHVPEAAVAVTAAIAAAVALVLAYGWPIRRPGGGIASWAGWVVAGALALALVPHLIYSNRYTDAPAGSIVVFWVTAFVGGVLCMIPFGDRVHVRTRAAAGLLGLIAAAGVLANWERPSSLNLLVRFTSEQLIYGLAGVLWAAFAVALAAAVRRGTAREVVVPASLGGLLGALVLALSPGLSVTLEALLRPSAVVFAVSSALLLLVVISLAARYGPALPGTALIAVPSALSLLSIVEMMTGAFGPRPILVDEVMWATVLGAAAVVVALWSHGVSYAGARSALYPRAVAFAALALGVTALFADSLAAEVRGTTAANQAFRAGFEMSGYETLGGWIVVCVALVSLALAFIRRTRMAALIPVIALALAAVPAWFALRFVPLHTWVTWIPPEVQQDYGTEYASIVFSGVGVPVQTASLALSVLACVLLAIIGVRDVRRAPQTPSEDEVAL